MTVSREPRPTYEELSDKLVILEAENLELTERSEELLLIGSLSEEMSACVSEGQLIEATLERVGLLKGLELAAYGDLTLTGFTVRYAYAPTTHAALTDVIVPPSLCAELAQPGAHVVSGPPCEGIQLRYGDAREACTPGTIVTVPVPTQNSPTSTIWLADTSPDSTLAGSLVALRRVADILATRLDNFRLLNELRELNRTLDTLVDQRTAELRMAVQRLSESEERFSRLVAAAGDAIFVVNTQACITDANPQACRSLGYTMSELLGKPLSDVEVSPSPIGYGDLTEALLASSTPAPAITRLGRHRRSDGSTFEVEIRVSPIAPAEAGAPPLMILARDISERVRLEQQLQQSQKMESIGRFAGGIAHDFNNLLTAILGYSEILLGEESSTGPDQEALQQIHAAGARAATLTQQLLAFSRRQVLDRRHVDLGTVIKEGCQMLRRIIGDDIVVDLRIEPAKTTVFADAVQLHQILLNLAVNARDAMPHGGRLVVGVAKTTIDATTASLQPDFAVGDYIVLTVADNGVGMPLSVQARLFEPFFTTKPKGQGTGLGLSNIYGIVKQHGGRITVYSELGQGTTFRVFFRASNEDESKQDASSVAGQPSRGVEHILVVDDNDEIGQFLFTGLSRLGYRVVLAGNGQEALDAIAAAQQDPFALVLSDVVMPVMNGYELATRLSASHPTLPIVLMSGFLDDQIETGLPLLRDIPIVQKPISLLELSRILRHAMA